MTFQQYPFKGGIPSGNTANRPSNPVIGDTYYNGELEVLEIYNGTTWVASSAPPATPSITSVTDVGTGLDYATGGTLTVVVAPGTGGSTALQYNVSTTAGGFSASSSSTTVSLTGLTPATSFIVVSSASNNFGTTVNSNPSANTLVTTKPQTPTIGAASTSGVTSDVTVTWTLGSNGGKNLSAITITPYLNGTTAQTSVTAATTSSTSHVFTGLSNGSAYTFKVKTTNANGDSPESSATNSVTIPVYYYWDVLIVAGGGAGGNWHAGGGGAGGLRQFDNLITSPGDVKTITVGAGGAGGSSSRGSNGVDSTAFGYTSSGGGVGGNYQSQPALSGGSGGGGNGDTIFPTGGSGNTPSTSPSQGNAGGNGNYNHAGGGGGGAGAAGASATSTTDPGVGGGGIDWKSLGTYYAGGGGGGTWAGGTAAAGGSGGGGTGSCNFNSTRPTVGGVNTGGGGGGFGGNDQGAANQITGGSGVVIMRTSGTYTAQATTGSPTRTVTGGYTYYKFTGNGSITI